MMVIVVIVILDGMDKCGKTTISMEVSKRLQFEYVRFPFRREIFAEVYKGEVEPYEAMLLFAYDYNSVLKRLDKKKNYVFDRSFISALLYQGTQFSERYGLTFREAVKEILNIYRPWYSEWVVPDLVFLLKVSPEEFLRRMDMPTDVFEKVEFQRELYHRVDVLYDILVNDTSFSGSEVVLIDTTDKTLDEVKNIIMEKIKERILVPPILK